MTAITPNTALKDTNVLYASIPEYLQDWDAANGYQMLSWLDGVCSMLEPTDDLARDNGENGGVGWSLLFDYYYYYSGTLNKVHCTGLANNQDVIQALSVLPWLAQFVGVRLQQIPYEILNNDADIVTNIQPYINDWVEQIVLTNTFERGTLSSFTNLFAKFLVNLSSNNLNSNKVAFTSAVSTAGSGNTQGSIVYTYDPVNPPYGSIAVGDYLNVYGFLNNNFNVSTVLVSGVDTTAHTVTVISPGVATDSTTGDGNGNQTISPSAFTVLEQTKLVYQPTIEYLYDAYSITVLVPKKYFPISTYSIVFGFDAVTNLPTNAYTYYIPGGAGGYATYSLYPNVTATVQTYVNLILPAGLTFYLLSV